jgi:hypothetical protein
VLKFILPLLNLIPGSIPISSYLYLRFSVPKTNPGIIIEALWNHDEQACGIVLSPTEGMNVSYLPFDHNSRRHSKSTTKDAVVVLLAKQK